MRKITKAISLATAALFASPVAAFAADITITKPDLFQFEDLGKLLGNTVQLILIVAALIFFLMLVVGGIQWMVSGGDKAGTEAARNRITAALIGLLIIFAAWAIIKLVETFLGISVISGGGVDIPKPIPKPK